MNERTANSADADLMERAARVLKGSSMYQIERELINALERAATELRHPSPRSAAEAAATCSHMLVNGRREQPAMSDQTKLEPDRLVAVCSACLRACCWQGAFYCDDYRRAGTVTKTVADLRAEQHGESEDYWRAG